MFRVLLFHGGGMVARELSYIYRTDATWPWIRPSGQATTHGRYAPRRGPTKVLLLVWVLVGGAAAGRCESPGGRSMRAHAEIELSTRARPALQTSGPTVETPMQLTGHFVWVRMVQYLSFFSWAA